MDEAISLVAQASVCHRGRLEDAGSEIAKLKAAMDRRRVVKHSRDTHYGHKVCFTCGASNLTLDCVILEGNPTDTDLVEQMLDRQKHIYGRYPLKVALDGGFASKDNLSKAKERKIKDVCFAQKRGLRDGYVPGRI